MRKASRTSSRNKKGVVTKIALGLLALSGGLVAIAMAPGIGMALKLIDPNPRKAMDKLERALRRLVDDGEVERTEMGQSRMYRLTPTGTAKLARLQFAEHIIPKPKKWDGVWRIVCFDIPETDKYVRTVFQYKLSDIGFYRLQNSVFVYPYPCDTLVALANQAFGLQKYVRLIQAHTIDNEALLLNFFRISK